MPNKKITPSQVNEILKNKGERSPSHYRDGAAKTERSVNAVINAAGKTRACVPNNILDLAATPEKNRKAYNSGQGNYSTSVSDRFRFATGRYWSRRSDALVYVSDVNKFSSFELSFNPDGTTTTEMSTEELRRINLPPSTSFMPVFHDVVKLTPSNAPVYERTENLIQGFHKLVDTVVTEGVWYEDHYAVINVPYSLRDIERFTTSTNTMYASVRPTYNFFIPDYETAADGLHEALLPNMYVMLTEMAKDEEPPNRLFNRHITLNGGLTVETRSEMLRPPSERKRWDIKDSLAVQYFDMYGRQVHDILSEEEKTAQPGTYGTRFMNLFVTHSNVDIVKNFNSRKELFPMFTDIEFSTDTTTEFAQALSESGMGAHLMNSVSSRSLTNRNFVEEVKTSVQAASDVVGANEIITRSELLESKRRVFDISDWYESLGTSPDNVPDNFFTDGQHTFLGSASSDSEVTDDPKYNLFRSLMSVVFSSKVRDIVRARTRTYKEIMQGKPAHTETVMYRVEKRSGGRNGAILQNFWLPNSNDIEIHKFIDTQVKYGRNYTYTIYAYELVYGSKYKYQGLWKRGAEAGFLVHSEPSLKIVELPYFSHTNRLLDSPPVMPDIEIIPFRGVADKIKINFSANVGRYDMMPEALEKGEARIHNVIRQAQDRLDGEPIRYESDDHAEEFQVYRLTRHPYSYMDFHGMMKKSVLTDIDPETQSKATSASYVDEIEPNKKYWYTFRSVDNHGHVSYPSAIYQVEMIDDHGSIYPIIKSVDFAPRTPKISSKKMKRFMQIVPTFSQGMLNEEKSGLLEAASVADRWDKDTFFLGVEDETLWGKKFKIRLTSRKTGRKIDVNIVFEHKHEKIQPE